MKCFVGLLVLFGCGMQPDPQSRPSKPETDEQRLIRTLDPLQEKLPKPGPSDWLASHAEPGQSFVEYRRTAPVLPRGRRKVLYIQPIGEMDLVREDIVRKTAQYLRLFYGVPVKTRKALPVSILPDHARRRSRGFGEQILSTYVLDKVLRKRLPRDAVAMLGLTAKDLWPGRGWNFVFGQASLRGRVGVWSIARNGDPTKNDKAYELCLRRTLKTAVHETGHMFSMQHCVAWHCVMNGSNNRVESDRQPLWACSQCATKVVWGMRKEPLQRYRKLLAFCRAEKLERPRRFFERCVKAVATIAKAKRPATSRSADRAATSRSRPVGR